MSTSNKALTTNRGPFRENVYHLRLTNVTLRLLPNIDDDVCRALAHTGYLVEDLEGYSGRTSDDIMDKSCDYIRFGRSDPVRLSGWIRIVLGQHAKECHSTRKIFISGCGRL